MQSQEFVMPRPLAILMIAGLAASVLAGCVMVPAQPYGTVASVQPYYGNGGYGYGDGGGYAAPVVPVAPPPPQVEYAGPPPVAGYIWLGGYWGWHDGRHEWMRGHWEAPRPGYVWSPHVWVHEGDGWRLHGGRWQPRR
jgi:hypothetical protein